MAFENLLSQVQQARENFSGDKIAENVSSFADKLYRRKIEQEEMDQKRKEFTSKYLSPAKAKERIKLQLKMSTLFTDPEVEELASKLTPENTITFTDLDKLINDIIAQKSSGSKVKEIEDPWQNVSQGTYKAGKEMIAGQSIDIPKDGKYQLQKHKVDGTFRVLPLGVSEEAPELQAARITRGDREIDRLREIVAELKKDKVFEAAREIANQINGIALNINQRNPVIVGMIQSQVARILAQEKGALSEGDVKRASGIQSVMGKLKQWLEKATTGNLSDENAQGLLAAIDAMNDKVAMTLKGFITQLVKEAASDANKNITSDDAQSRLSLADDMIQPASVLDKYLNAEVKPFEVQPVKPKVDETPKTLSAEDKKKALREKLGLR